ncbi:RICIN domain-containing protein [Phytohabitans flavus]|uniref:RICIN domain-containing protein n=1 Tax=Phytohabitans flavus TaxID=1076124 RepID=UPI0036405DC5
MLEIRLSFSGQLLTVHGDSTASGATVDVHRKVTTADGLAQRNQLWQFLPGVGGQDILWGAWGRLRNVNSGKCLDMPGGDIDGERFTQVACEVATQWQARETSPGSKRFSLQAAGTNRYLGINEAFCVAPDNTRLRSKFETGNDCADWTIVQMGGDAFFLGNSYNAGLRIDSNDPANGWNTPARLKPANDQSPTQRWYFQRAGSTAITPPPNIQWTGPGWAALYRIVSVRGNDWDHATCLGTHGDQPAVGAVADTWACGINGVNQTNQLWIIGNTYTYPYGHTMMRDGVRSLNLEPRGADFAMMNSAMLAPDRNIESYPVLSAADTFAPVNGSYLRMLEQKAPYALPGSQTWRRAGLPTPAPPSTPSGDGGSGPRCTGFAALLCNWA